MQAEARVAAYYAPALDDPLWQCGAAWLGRDAETGAPRAQPAVDGIAEATASPALYGFHATLKPPMRLVDPAGWDAFCASAEAVAGRIAPFDLPPLAVTDIHGFLALRETRPSAALQSLCDAMVAGLDMHRAAPTEAELARRRKPTQSAAEAAMITRWGYPYVFETWFFHMTLTRRLDGAEHARFRPAAEAFFAEALALPRRVVDVCLFTQAATGAAFRLAARVPLRGGA